MLCKTITYTDYDGNKQTEDFLFNLSKAECMEMELETSGGVQNLIKQIINERDRKRIAQLFKKMILTSYGKKSLDGKHFYKSPEIAADFASTEAFSELYMELSTDADAAAEFITGVLPISGEDAQKVIAQAKEQAVVK